MSRKMHISDKVFAAAVDSGYTVKEMAELFGQSYTVIWYHIKRLNLAPFSERTENSAMPEPRKPKQVRSYIVELLEEVDDLPALQAVEFLKKAHINLVFRTIGYDHTELRLSAPTQIIYGYLKYNEGNFLHVEEMQALWSSFTNKKLNLKYIYPILYSIAEVEGETLVNHTPGYWALNPFPKGTARYFGGPHAK